jgi:SAM-dependent methyltransferase
MGQYLVALRKRGYDIEGVEWGAETVKAVKSIYPDLPIREADVTKLDVPDGYYRGYISLGVVEHRPEGPEPYLQEAYRVLRPDGVAFVSVPCFHALRRMKARLGLYRGSENGREFYQFAFNKTEFAGILASAGFKIVDHMTYSVFKGLQDEIFLLKWLLSLRGIGWRFKRFLRSRSWIDQNLGHMILFICRKSVEPAGGPRRP